MNAMRLAMAGAFVCLSSAAFSTAVEFPPNAVSICDPNNPSNCLAPDSSGNMPTTGGGGGGGGSVTQGTIPWVVSGAASAALATDAHLTALGTGALATDAHLTTLGTSALATDSHLTTFTSANHTDLAAVNTTLGTPFQAGGSLGSQYPATAVPITASATGTTGATTATLTNVSGHTTFICGFSIRANATAAATNNATVTGTKSGTLNFTQWTAPLATGLGITEEAFVPCIPASGTSVSIAVVSGAPGSGGVVSVTAWGYSL